MTVNMDRVYCVRCLIESKIYLMMGDEHAKRFINFGAICDEKSSKFTKWIEINFKCVHLSKVEMGKLDAQSWVLQNCTGAVFIVGFEGMDEYMEKRRIMWF